MKANNPTFKSLISLFIFLFSLSFTAFAQVSINPDNAPPDPSAGLDVKFTDRGALIPRVTMAQRDSIVNPANGLMVICTDCGDGGSLNIYLASTWKAVYLSTPCPSAPFAGTHVPSPTQIIWNWSIVSTATGYKWNITNDYYTATDIGNSTTKTETGLICITPYTRYVWAYNSCGNSAVTTLTQTTSACPWACGQSITDSRDSKTYPTVLIGTQCWLAKNLNVGTRVNGSGNQSNNSTIEKYCYNDLESNCDVYGGLYQWDEYMNYTSSSNSNPSGRTGICPVGWHVPSDAEWCQMSNYLDGTVNCSASGFSGTNAGGKMKETGTSHWLSPNQGATNSSGFNGLPAGNRINSGSYFQALYNFSDFYTSTENSVNAWRRGLNYNYAQIFRGGDLPKAFGFSGRCVKD
jgi:uncharacterized protein (TIGR02145 family)